MGATIGSLIATNKDIASSALISLLASVLIYYGITSNRDRGKYYWISLGTLIIIISITFAVWFFSQGQSKRFPLNQWAFDLFKSMPKTTGISLGIHGIGALFSAVIPVIIGALLFLKNKAQVVLLIVLILLLIFILFLSVSGGGWIAFVISLFGILICWRKRSVYFLIPISGLMAGVALYYYTKINWLYASFSIETLMSRINLWMKTIPLLRDIHSFLGLGLGAWVETYNTLYNSVEVHLHNNYLQVFTDMGIFGVLAMLSAAAIFTVTAWKIVNANTQSITKGIGIGLIGSFLGGAFFNCLDVTLTGTITEHNSYLYLSIPFLWIWAACYSVVFHKLNSQHEYETKLPGVINKP
ncbi:MAG: O-antigen ligase family protein [Dehalococcoidales bacterium]|nr:O-antigen ligase family protein [Dehalococcoidales bacterium]